MKKLLFIVNPRAGRTKSTAPLFDAVARFSQVGYLVRVFVTCTRGDATQAVAECGAEYDLVVCAGGDGTFNETVSGLMAIPAEQRPPVGYLPCGSTNDFASSLHLPSNPSMAAAAVACGRCHPLDVGMLNDRVFTYVASFGAFTRASYSTPQSAKNILGHLAYILEGVHSLDSLRPYHCLISADGESLEGDFIFGAVCNSTSLGGLVKLDPHQVQMDDGSLELILLRMPKNVFELNQLITGLNRMEYSTPGILFRHIRSAQLTTDAQLPWSLDGEYYPSHASVDIRCVSGGIRLMM